MKKIKTIVENICKEEWFDREVNEALMDGWRLEKRMVIVPGEEYCMLYAELVKEDKR